MGSDSDDAAAHVGCGGVKRQRERELADKRQEHRVEDVLAHTTHIVDAIAGINTGYIHTLNAERESLTRRVDELQTLHTSGQLKQSEATSQLVYHNLKSLRGVVGNTVKERLLHRLRAQVDQGQADVLESLTAHVDEALQGSLTVAETQLSAERQLSAQLVEQLRAYAQTLLASARAADQRAFQAEVEAMRKDVLVAKLRATHLFEQNRLLRHEQEVEALMRVVAQLAEKSRFVESARTELQKAKRHVRWLEQYLDVKGIVAAVPSELTTVANASVAVSTSAASPPPPPPNPALRQSAPHYFALKMLEHKDITLTELVDSWQGQEARIAAGEQRYTQLEAVVRQVQRDALVVHQRYLEEKQRREIADRRITDMVRERLYPQKDASVFNEVQRLRWAYTEVVDDAAQLAVNLKVCRDDLQEAQAEVARLNAQVQTLQRDAETDKVALTIEELRRGYAERVRSLEEVSVRTQLQLTLAQQVSRQYGSVAEEAATALQQASETNAELSAVPPHVVYGDGPAKSRDWRCEVQEVEEQAQCLVDLAAEIKNYGLEHGELYDEQINTLMTQWSRVRSEAAERAEHARGDLSHSEATASTSFSGGVSESRTLVASTLSEESATRAGSIAHSSKLALLEALMLLVASLQSADVERSSLLDASLSDAQYVTELVKEVSAISSERDRLRAQVKVCRDLLEKNHVTVVERALMHDVPAEDSLNVAEAAERITVLRDELNAARQLCDRALGEVRQVTAEKEVAEAKLTELSRSHEVLQGHAARLAERLRASMSKEVTFMEEAASLQSQIVHLAQPPTSSSEDGAPPTTTPSELSALFSTLTDTLQQLDGEVRTLRASRGDQPAGVADSTEEDTSATMPNHETTDAELLNSLSRSGMMNIVGVLKDTLQKAGLLKAALKTATGAHAAALCATAATTSPSSASGEETGSSASVIPLPSLETQRQALEYRAAQHEAERQQMRERLQRAEQTSGELGMANQRLLAISKSLLEKQNTLKTENEQLRAQVRELSTAVAAATTTVAAAPLEAPQTSFLPSVPQQESNVAEVTHVVQPIPPTAAPDARSTETTDTTEAPLTAAVGAEEDVARVEPTSVFVETPAEQQQHQEQAYASIAEGAPAKEVPMELAVADEEEEKKEEATTLQPFEETHETRLSTEAVQVAQEDEESPVDHSTAGVDAASTSNAEEQEDEEPSSQF